MRKSRSCITRRLCIHALADLENLCLLIRLSSMRVASFEFTEHEVSRVNYLSVGSTEARRTACRFHRRDLDDSI